MNSLLDFAKGPLFRLSFAVMILGLARIFFLDIWGAYKAYRKTDHKKMPWKLIIRRTFEWYFPVKKFANNRHVYSFFSILFHIGLIAIPIFLFAHINMWKNSIGVSWPALPYWWAFGITLVTIAAGLIMLIARMVIKSIRFLSRGQDYLWLILLLFPFITGFICANLNIGASTYHYLMLIHILSGELIFILIPFSKIAHFVLTPMSQIIDVLAWKFPPETDDDISATLNKKGAPV